MILVTGGCGFIGSNFVRYWLKNDGRPILNFDALTYAGNPMNLEGEWSHPRHIFIRGDLRDFPLLCEIFEKYPIEGVIHFAAESHVDRSILGPRDFIDTNIVGTFNLLEVIRVYYEKKTKNWGKFRMLHVSTDEVFGSLGPEDPPFHEKTPYAPNSPYAASKAASDHLVRAYAHTYNLPLIITNCSNNYGPYQFPEKLIPLMIIQALEEKPLPIYGDGLQIRDWLYVEDHAAALYQVYQKGKFGETYNIGGEAEKTNLEVVQTICSLMDEKRPRPSGRSYRELIKHVPDRPGHDRRYAMNITKIKKELGWSPRESFDSGLFKTIEWYLHHQNWVKNIKNQSYREWIEKQYGKTVASHSI